MLADSELIKSLRASDILKNCRLKEELTRRAATIEFVNHTELDPQDQGIRDQLLTYLRSVSRILRNEFYDQQSSNLGLVATYGHTRRMPHVGNYNDRNRRGEYDRKFPMGNRPNSYVNFDVGGQEDGGDKIGNIMMKNQGILSITGGSFRGPSVTGGK